MAKKKKETKIEEKKPELKKYNTFQIGLIVLLTITILTLCGVLLVQKIGIYLDTRKTMNEFNEFYEGEEPSVIFYMSTNCVYCEMQQPILDQIAKDYDIDYLKIDKMNLSEKNLREIEEKLGLDGATPATVIVKDGEVVTGNTGYLDGYEYIKIFIDGGILDEGSKYKPEENLTFIDYQQFLELFETNEPDDINLYSNVSVNYSDIECVHLTGTRLLFPQRTRTFFIVVMPSHSGFQTKERISTFV